MFCFYCESYVPMYLVHLVFRPIKFRPSMEPYCEHSINMSKVNPWFVDHSLSASLSNCVMNCLQSQEKIKFYSCFCDLPVVSKTGILKAKLTEAQDIR